LISVRILPEVREKSQNGSVYPGKGAEDSEKPFTKGADRIESWERMDNLRQRSYQVLGLPSGAPEEEVREAFLKIKEGLSGKDWEKLKEATWAYEVLAKSFGRGGEERVLEDRPAEGGPSLEMIKEKEDAPGPRGLKSYLFPVEEKINPFFIAGRAVVLVLALIWGFKYAIHSVGSNYAGESFLHNVSLPFHEAGHVLFSPFGDFLAVLGGSLLQLMIPAICVVAFFKREDMFGASVAVWWLGQNFIDLAPYINDARAQELILLGGVTGQDVPGFHDWNNILGALGLLRLDHFIGHLSHYFGVLLMIASLIWGGYLLYLQWKNVDL
jgi:hypothetical protein